MDYSLLGQREANTVTDSRLEIEQRDRDEDWGGGNNELEASIDCEIFRVLSEDDLIQG